MVTQDGTQVDVVTKIAGRCDHSGATGICKSYVPSAPSEPGVPPTGW